MKKKKIFLAAYVNHINAQNINCRSIAYYLDKEKYDVKCLLLGNQNIPIIKGVGFFKVNQFGFKLSNIISFIRAVLWADVCYVPKHQSTPKIALRLARFLNKKIFTTIEGNMCDTSRGNMINSFGTVNNMKDYFKLIPNIFGITSDIIDNANCGIILNSSPLFLGVENKMFNDCNSKKELNQIVFIGSLIKRKRISEFLELAANFPSLTFNIVGSGPEKKYLELKSTKNVIFHNILNHTQLAELLKSMDLHFLPSKSEGFPKVVLETAAASVPSILYNTYGSNSWINNNENGFLVSDFSDVKNIVNHLLQNPNIFHDSSVKVYQLAEKFNWKHLIKNWERVIENLR